MKRITSLVLLAFLSALSHGTAHAEVLRFQGQARIDLYERLDHDDPGSVAVTTVDVSIDLHGPRVLHQADAIGEATVDRGSGSPTTIALLASMYPPEGSGGFVHATGLGDDGSIYCFRIWDLADAPTPRPDRVIAAFEPLDRFTEGFAATPTIVALGDICHALEHRAASVHAGDLAFSTVV